MVNRPSNEPFVDQVPMLFRAQVNERCQLHFIDKNKQKQDVLIWTNEWTAAIASQVPQFTDNVQERIYQISWRFVTNGGQDDGVVRPVIGAQGWPYFPGSSMKGAFRSACTSLQSELRDLYCGKVSGGDHTPGILRFHGGYPTTISWRENLIDVIHPQQDWQVKSSPKEGGAFAGISLYRPELRFGISSTQLLTDAEWEAIWQIWEVALGKGIGSRVSAGYGQPGKHGLATMHSVNLKGQGLASKLLNGKPEFRPNMFKSALRGHTLRILGGLTDAATAEQLTDRLWGGIGKNCATVGLVGTAFNYDDLWIGKAGRGHFAQNVYEVEGTLDLLIMRDLGDAEARKKLRAQIRGLIIFSMLLGGFGKSWRRADHQLFFPDYVDNRTPIGCHWSFRNSGNDKFIVPVESLTDISQMIEIVRGTFLEWLRLNSIPVVEQGATNWREAWHPDKVQVWARSAKSKDDSVAIKWFHGSNPQGPRIYGTPMVGKINQIGRIWHRMYPRYVKKDGQLRSTTEFIELLTIFPDNSEVSNTFLEFLSLGLGSTKFYKVWPVS
jgi:CRISPR-associated protein Cmr6